jgi:uroporphyrinogen decarboxylase
MLRREFLALAAGAALASSRMTSKERVDRALRGEEVDRTPFSYWHHFLDDEEPGSSHARSTLEFHRKFRTDLVKVMSDYPYPRPQGTWWQLSVTENPFPAQVEALQQIRDGLGGQAYFVETLFNSWKVAENLSSPEAVRQLRQENPDLLLSALDIITISQIHHARKAIAAGAAGIFLAIANAQEGVMTQQDYQRFSEPFDRRILESVPEARLNILHLHGDKVWLDRFAKGWPAAAINYSPHGTGVGIAEFRRRYRGVLMAGLDERNYRQLQTEELKRQWQAARQAAGRRFILTPGCSVPNESSDEELLRLPNLLAA